ncbi:GNAT family N-acetyltransferase [Actinoallomurus acaciae]|uniref:GNAT family N-acetyltransferase n=1 Tax=Actinoallomurus acaciae TaxID=502577 RepID=A0ABV5YW80_9ACTN
MTEIALEPWAEDDLDLLRRLNTPEIWAHLGGPETEEKVVERHARYLDLGAPGSGRMFTVVLPDGAKAGTIGYWEREWQGETVYETGWNVLPEHQGRGIAGAAATAIVARARVEKRHRRIHAYPSVDNPASNAICRKAGFTFAGEHEFEFPKGHFMRCNDWHHDL